MMSDLNVDENTASRSILVDSLPSGVEENEIVIHFQSRKHGGGDIEKVVLLGNGSALVTFDNKKIVSSVQEAQHRIQGVMLTVQPYPYMKIFSSVLAKINPKAINFSIERTRAMVARLQKEQNVTCTEKVDNTFVISGSYEQIVKCHDLLCDLLSKRKHELDGKRKEELNESDTPSQQLPKEICQKNCGTSNGQDAEKKETLQKINELKMSPQKESCQRNLKSGAGKKEASTKSGVTTNTTKVQQEIGYQNAGDNVKEAFAADSKDMAASSEETTCSKEIKVSAKEWQICAKVHEDYFKKIKEQYAVDILVQNCIVLIKPLKVCDDDMLRTATKSISDLYESAISNMECVRFALADPSNETILRKTVMDIKKKFAAVLERAQDRQNWEVFGEKKTVDMIMQVLESKVKIKKVEPKSEEANVSDEANANDEDDIDDGVSVSAIEDDIEDNTATEENDHYDENTTKCLEHNLGCVKLSIYKGDITNETCDAIVNAANQNLSHDAGVAKTIVFKGGSSIQEESTRIVSTKGKLRTGDATITHSGGLSCKMIIHAVGPIWKTSDKENSKALLKRAIFSSIQQAEKYSFKSIAFPAISSGLYGMPKPVCAQVMFDTVEEYNNATPASRSFKVSDIRFVNNDIKTVNIFQREFKKRYGQGNTTKEPVSTKRPQTSAFDVQKKMIDDLERDIIKQKIFPSTWLTKDNSSPMNEHAVYRNGKAASRADQKAFYDDTLPFASSKHQDHKPRHLHPRRYNSVRVNRSPYYHPEDTSHYQSQTQSRGGKQIIPLFSSEHGGARPKEKPISKCIGPVGMHYDEKKYSTPSKKRSEDLHEDNKCPVCLAPIVNPKTLPTCKHTFCKTCLDNALKESKKCPLCRKPLSDGHIGNQPEGRMVHRVEQFSLPGYEQYGTIVIQYSFDGGIQGKEHPNPGEWYNATTRSAYLPNNKQGREVLKLLERAFNCKLVFKIGQSITSRMDNQIVWGEIPHKSSIDGGVRNYGYPDPTYLSEVHQILKAMLSK